MIVYGFYKAFMDCLILRKDKNMNKYISRGIKDISPFVYMEVFKKYGNTIKDYAVIRVRQETDDGSIVWLIQEEPLKGAKTYTIRTGTFQNREQLLVLVRMDNENLVLLTFNEMVDILREKNPRKFDTTSNNLFESSDDDDLKEIYKYLFGPDDSDNKTLGEMENSLEAEAEDEDTAEDNDTDEENQ